MNNSLDRILFVQPKDRHSGAGLLILNDVLPVVGRVLQFKNEYLMENNIITFQLSPYEQVKGYNILISYAGTLGDGDKKRIKDVYPTLEEMAEWYLQNKIRKHAPHWKRYKQI